ncbi:MAG TPA: PAC2 family protein [Actinomycetota bacterium]|nr:PAC2 family protein [Actinomycetota bacterium]
MDLYTLTSEPRMRAPVLIIALDGWVDAAAAATTAANQIAEDGEQIARFNMDLLIDYRARRPVLDIVDGDLKSLAWSELTARVAKAGDRDLVVLTGVEPDFRWRELSDAVHELCVRLGIVESVTLGSLGLAVPHTRPTQITATASRPEVLGPDDQRTEGLLRVPAAAVSVIEMNLRDHGIPTVGFFAQTPHYVTATYAPAVLALLERLGRHLGVMLPVGSLADDAVSQREQLDRIVEQRPEIKEYVERLEAAYQPGWSIPSADELGAEIERFLRRQGDEGRGSY